MSYPSNNNSSRNSELFANFVAQAQFATYENSIARQITTVFDVPMNQGKVVQIPLWANITAELITDEAAATLKNTDTSAPTVTLAEHVVYSQVTDMLRDSAYGDVMAQLADQSGRAIAQSIDQQAFATFSDFTDIGSTTTDLTVNLILQAAATLRAQRLTGPFYAVVAPGSAFALMKQLTYTADSAANIPMLSSIGENVMGNFYVGTVGGVSIFESTVLPTVTTGGANAYSNAVFSPRATAHAMRGGIDMNTLYLPQARATDMVLKAVAGAGTINSSWGVRITANAAL
jgi:hypothetical protein